MSMEKRALLAVVLSLLILVLYQEWVVRRYGSSPIPPPQPAEEQVERKVHKQPTLPPQPQPEFREPAALAAPPIAEAREIRVETDYYVALFTSRGGRLKSFTLKQYRANVAADSPPIEMVSSAPEIPHPLGVRLSGPQPFDDEGFVYSVRGSAMRLAAEGRGTLEFYGRTPSGNSLTKRFTFFGSRYPIEMEISVDGAGKNEVPGIVLTSPGKGPTEDTRFEGILGLMGKTVIRDSAGDMENGKNWTGEVSWAGFGYTYFLFALLPENGGEQQIDVRKSGPALLMNLQDPQAVKNGGKSHYTLFVGPKDLDVLNSMERGLEKSIDFGYFAFVAIPFLYVMRFFHNFTHNYGVDIILLSFLLKLLTAPLTHKSFVSMKQMQKLQPQMERIKEKFKGDRERLNKEIMELYRRNKVNPFGGCFPMLLQLPIFVGLYNALLTPIELRHAPFMWVKDLSQPDWKSLPVTLPSWLGGNVGIPVLTLLMGASMFVQQWMTPSAGDPNQRRMMLIMPVFFTAIFVTFPAGLTIYWLVNNVLSIAQQYMINRMGR